MIITKGKPLNWKCTRSVIMIMKISLSKLPLIATSAVGVFCALLIYGQVLFFLSKLFNLTGYNWMSFFILLVISWLIGMPTLKAFAKDLVATNALSEITLSKIVKSYFGGFTFFYMILSFGGTLILGSYLLFRNFLF